MAKKWPRIRPGQVMPPANQQPGYRKIKQHTFGWRKGVAHCRAAPCTSQAYARPQATLMLVHKPSLCSCKTSKFVPPILRFLYNGFWYFCTNAFDNFVPRSGRPFEYDSGKRCPEFVPRFRQNLYHGFNRICTTISPKFAPRKRPKCVVHMQPKTWYTYNPKRGTHKPQNTEHKSPKPWYTYCKTHDTEKTKRTLQKQWLGFGQSRPGQILVHFLATGFSKVGRPIDIGRNNKNIDGLRTRRKSRQTLRRGRRPGGGGPGEGGTKTERNQTTHKLSPC